MPTFPSYDGPPLPEVLNPLNPRHYWMLADWIFFKPSRLRQYLHHADPELYFQSGWRALLSALLLPACRSLLWMVPILVLIISALFSAPASWAVSAAQGTEANWGRWAVGVAVGAAFGVALGMTLRVAGGVAVGVAGGAAFGVAGGAAFGAAFGVASGVAFGVADGVAHDAASGVAFGVAVGVALGVAVDVAYGVTSGAGVVLLFGVAFGIALVVAPAIGVPRSAVLDMVFNDLGGVLGGVASGVAYGVGLVRGVFYAFQVCWALGHLIRLDCPSRRLASHPGLRDELAVLPFPGLARLLAEVLAEDFPAGLRAARGLLRDPFQRWAVGRGFARFLAAGSDPLTAVYRALPDPLLDEYPVEPLDEQDVRLWPPVLALWLGELGGVFVDGSGGPFRSFERLAWVVTCYVRGRHHQQVAPLARFLLRLLDEEQVANAGPELKLLEEAATAVRGLPHGEEVALSLAALARLAGLTDLEGIARAWRGMGWLERLPKPPLRPQVVEALRGLGDVAAEVARYHHATSPATQAGALNRAVGMLNELEGYVEDIHLPERTLLRLAVRRWQSVVAGAAGRMGERALREMAPDARRALAGGARRADLWSRPAEPFPNPYKTGDPVAPPMLVGRGDVFHRIQGVWGSKANPDSVILYGHRRMGKSSILRNLEPYAPPGSLLVYADLKGESAFAEGTHHLLRALADAVVWYAEKRGLALPQPDPADYATPAEATLFFRRLLRRALAALPEGGSLILALDEFEAVDEGVRDNKIGTEIYDYLRSLSQEPHVVLVFAGLHTLDEMSRDYCQAFFGSYVNIPVSYLSRKAAEQLIARPTPDFPLDYHARVVARVIHETHGQPLLVQRICQELVNHVNHELFDLEPEKDREARVLPEDLEAVLGDDFVRGETRYFDGIWSDQVAGRGAVETALRALAAGPATAEALARGTGLPLPEVIEALTYLKTRDLADVDAEGRWDLIVPLMRRWLRLRAGRG